MRTTSDKDIAINLNILEVLHIKLGADKANFKILHGSRCSLSFFVLPPPKLKHEPIKTNNHLYLWTKLIEV